jgi:hypothetical protein
VTDDSGIYRLEGLPEGRYYIQTRHGYPETYYPGVLGSNNATAVTLQPGSLVTEVNFRLARNTFTARGRVSGRPNQSQPGPGQRFSGVWVTGPRSFTREVGNDGTFVVEGLIPGHYRIQLEDRPAVFTAFDVVNDDVTGIELLFPRMIAVSGLFLPSSDTDQLPPRIELGFFDGEDYLYAFVGADGKISALLPIGEYTVELMAPLPADCFIRSMTAGPADLLTTPLRITDDAPPRLTVTLGRSTGVEIRGRVTGLGAQTPAGARLLLTRTIGNGYRVESAVETPLDANGAFRIPKLLPGVYAARALLPGMPAPPSFITIPERDAGNFEIAAPELKAIRGEV